MQPNDLFELCPPARVLSTPHYLSNDIFQLRLKIQNQPNSFPIFTDSNDLISKLKKDFRTNKEYKEYQPYDLLTNVHYRERKDNYYIQQSRPIHYGIYDKEQSFVVKSNPTDNPDIVDQLYKQAVLLNRQRPELANQRFTYYDTLLINRRLLQLNLRAMSRETDSNIIIFKYDWLRGELK